MTCCAGTLPAHCATERGSQAEMIRLEEAKRAAKPLGDGTLLLRLGVPAVHCAQCISTIERGLVAVPGVQSARVNLSLRQVAVNTATEDSIGAVLTTLDRLGYDAQVTAEGRETDSEVKGLLRALAVAGFAAANIMLLSISVWNGADDATRDLFHFISGVIAVPAVAYAGQPFFRSAFNALRHRRMNMDVPIALGVTLATGMSLYESFNGGHHAYFDAAVSLLFFLLIGRTLDVVMRGRARQLVEQMARLSARGGMRLGVDGTLSYVPQDQIAPGMILRISVGERLPADAEVLSGDSLVDRSLVTGEAEPVPAATGTVLEAGVLNLHAPLDVKALRSAEKSFLGEVTQMLTAAEQGRGHYVRLADRMARLYSPVVHILAFLSFLGWMIYTGGDWHTSITIAVAVLIITCPCALGLAVPVAHVIAASHLFRKGILVKDGAALERLAEIDHAAFDKTGTLTNGNLGVEACDIPEGVLADIALAMANASRHPAARALSRYLARHLAGASPVTVGNISELAGFGTEARYEGKTYRLGRASWASEITSRKTQGSGLVFGVEGGPAFATSFRETLRAGVADVVQSLRASGISAEILSGDRADAVARVARAATMPRHQAEMTPAGKLAHLVQLAGSGRKVLMVGDGLNDAPALAAAHVSMAPSSASDIGRNAADFVFLGESLDAVRQAHDVALRARAIVRQNFALAAAYNALAVPLAVLGYLNPFIAAVAMSSSSIIVIANSMRLGAFSWPVKAAADDGEPTLRELQA